MLGTVCLEFKISCLNEDQVGLSLIVFFLVICNAKWTINGLAYPNLSRRYGQVYSFLFKAEARVKTRLSTIASLYVKSKSLTKGAWERRMSCIGVDH